MEMHQLPFIAYTSPHLLREIPAAPKALSTCGGEQACLHLCMVMGGGRNSISRWQQDGPWVDGARRLLQAAGVRSFRLQMPAGNPKETDGRATSRSGCR